MPSGCQARGVRGPGDWCGNERVPGSMYCPLCKCDVPGCVRKWGMSWPLVYRKLCSYHIDHPPDEQARELVRLHKDSMGPPDDVLDSMAGELAEQFDRETRAHQRK